MSASPARARMEGRARTSSMPFPASVQPPGRVHSARWKSMSAHLTLVGVEARVWMVSAPINVAVWQAWQVTHKLIAIYSLNWPLTWLSQVAQVEKLKIMKKKSRSVSMFGFLRDDWNRKLWYDTPLSDMQILLLWTISTVFVCGNEEQYLALEHPCIT